jgi:hypothetical protein
MAVALRRGQLAGWTGWHEAPTLPATDNVADSAGLIDALDDASGGVSAYLDLESGRVIWVTADVRQELEAITEDVPEETSDDEAYRAAFAAALDRRGPPAWMHALLWEADAVEGGLGTRFLPVPGADTRAGYADMEAFIETVASLRLRERFWGAIRGRGAFRRFKDALGHQPAELERWFAFRDGRVRQRALVWLAEEGIEPDEEGD